MAPCRQHSSFQFLFEHRQYACEIAKHIIVPKTHDPVALIPQPGAPFLVTPLRLYFTVMTSVDLNDHSPFQAYEVHDIGTDRMLTAKPVAGDLLVSNVSP